MKSLKKHFLCYRSFYPLTGVIKVVVVLLLFVVFSGCGAMVQGKAIRKTTVENGAIPAEYGEIQTTLIAVLTGRNSRDKYLKRHFQNYYHGRYVFVLRDDLDSTLYSDRQQYRYVFDFKEEQSPIMTTNHRT